MKKKSVSRFVRSIQSLKFRVFMIVAVSVMIPAILLSVFIAVMAINGYTDKQIDRFKSNNTMLKNSIISEGYIENLKSEIVDTQLNNCLKSIIAELRLLTDNIPF